MAARREVIDRLREFDEVSDGVAQLQNERNELQRGVDELETLKATLEKLDQLKLLAASEAAVVLYSTHIKKSSPDVRKNEDSYLRANGYILANNVDGWREVATGTVVVRQQALEKLFRKAIDPIWSEIIAGLRSREAVVLGRAPKTEGRA